MASNRRYCDLLCLSYCPPHILSETWPQTEGIATNKHCNILIRGLSQKHGLKQKVLRQILLLQFYILISVRNMASNRRYCDLCVSTILLHSCQKHGLKQKVFWEVRSQDGRVKVFFRLMTIDFCF